MSGGRFALLIAAGQYDSADLRRLRSPGRDVEGLAEVLADPSVGDFQVEKLVDARHHEVKRAIERFFGRRSRDDVLLLHISCHGIKDDDGDLFFAARDTDRELLGSTAVESAFLHTQMRRCRALSIVLLLDCCYSGAFLPGAKGDTSVHLKDELAGHGRAVLTATNRIEIAWEGHHLSELEPEPSRFTGAVIEGLRSGEADYNRDGLISHTDLYEYVYERMHAAGLRQRPLLWADVEFRVVVARAHRPRLLGGRYELGRLLGRDALSEIRAAQDTRLGRTVAVTTLGKDNARDPSHQAWFRRAIHSAASLDHPAIVAVHDSGEDHADGIPIPYLVTEYVDGSSLRELLDRDGRFPPERAMDVTVAILRALEHAHRNGVLHQRIDAATVMVTREDRVKVMGFQGDQHPAPSWLADEQAKPADARSDLYATGRLLHELLTNEPPLGLFDWLLDDPPPPRLTVPAVPAALDAIVLKALARQPAQGYQSAQEMRSAIEACRRGPAAHSAGARVTSVTSGRLLLTVSSADVTRVARLPEGAPVTEPRKRTEPERAQVLDTGPGHPALFLREKERETLVSALSRGRCIRLLGPSGSGRTTLLARVAADCAGIAPDGVIQLSGHRRTHDDLLHALFAAAYHAPRYRPDRRTLLKLSRDIGAIVLVDDVDTGRVDGDRLLAAHPECAFVLCPDPQVAPPPLQGAEDLMLRRLPQRDWLRLLESAAGRATTESERSWADDLYGESYGLPQRSVQAGALLRRTGESLPMPTTEALLRQLAVGLSESASGALGYTLALGGDVPDPPHLPALLGDSHGDRAPAELASCGLVTSSGSHHRLAGRVADMLRGTRQAEAAPARALHAAQHYAWWARHPSVTPERVTAEADAVLGALGAPIRDDLRTESYSPQAHREAVLTLCRAAAPAFAAGLRWGAWEQVLSVGPTAARALGRQDDVDFFDHELIVLAQMA